MVRSVSIFLLAIATCLAGQNAAAAQARPSAARSAAELSDDELVAAVANSLGPVGIVPRDRGLNASLISSSQHDSISGWSSLLTPSVAYRFNRYVSADVSTPVFLYLHSESTTVSAGGPNGPGFLTTRSNVQHGIVGDTYMAMHMHMPPLRVRRQFFFDKLSGFVIAPTGSVSDGVGAGKTTFNVTNHLEMGGRWSPYIDIGLGSSSRVQNRRLQQDQTSRGLLANFAAGVWVDLPHRWDFAAEAFEQLPIGTQHVSQTEARPGGPPQTQQTEVASGLAENNGFNTALDIPLARHFTLSGYYSRSLRQQEDIAGFSITFLLRAARNVR